MTLAALTRGTLLLFGPYPRLEATMDEKLYGDAAIYTQLQAPHTAVDGRVVVPVQVNHRDEQEDEPKLAGTVELRAVSMTTDEAREWALKVLTAAGPESDVMVETWIAGQIRLTMEAPAGCERVFDPSLFIRPSSREEFERVVAAVGGVTAFRPIDAEQTDLRSAVPALGMGQDMMLWMSLPPEMLERLPKPKIAAMVELKRVQTEQIEQTKGEQAAADRLVSTERQERVVAVLKEASGPVPLAYLQTAMGGTSETDLTAILNGLLSSGAVELEEDETLGTLYALPHSVTGSIMDDALAPGPEKGQPSE